MSMVQTKICSWALACCKRTQTFAVNNHQFKQTRKLLSFVLIQLPTLFRRSGYLLIRYIVLSCGVVKVLQNKKYMLLLSI